MEHATRPTLEILSPRILQWPEPEGPSKARTPRAKNQTSPLAVLLQFVAVIFLLMLPREAVEEAPAELLVWLCFGFLALLTAHGFRSALRAGENPWIAPGYLLMAFYTYLFGFGGLVAYYWGFVPWQVYTYMQGFFYEGRAFYNLSYACYLVTLGGIGLYLGTLLPRRKAARMLPALNWPVNETKLKAGMMMYAPVVLLVFAIVKGHLPLSLVFISVLFSSVTDGMIMAGGYYLFSAKRSKDKITWGGFLVLCLLAGLPSALGTGQIVPLLMPFMMILCGYVLARRTLPWVTLLTGAVAGIMIVLPFMAFYKFSGTKETPATERLAAAGRQYASASTGAKLEVALSRSLARFATIKFPAVYSQFYPNIYPFENGTTFALELSGLVPRLLWPDKPNKSTELNHYAERVGLVRALSDTSAVFDAISEYYVNFGAIGVLLFAILHGWYHSILYEWLVKGAHYLIGAAVYLCVMFGNWDFFGVVNLFESHVKTIPVWLLVYYVLSRSAKQRKTASAAVSRVLVPQDLPAMR